MALAHKVCLGSTCGLDEVEPPPARWPVGHGLPTTCQRILDLPGIGPPNFLSAPMRSAVQVVAQVEPGDGELRGVCPFWLSSSVLVLLETSGEKSEIGECLSR